jgi:hypothetical protein
MCRNMSDGWVTLLWTTMFLVVQNGISTSGFGWVGFCNVVLGQLRFRRVWLGVEAVRRGSRLPVGRDRPAGKKSPVSCSGLDRVA